MWNLKAIFGGVLVLAVLATVGAGYLHYRGLLAERDVLRADRIRLEAAVGAQEATILAQEEALGEWQRSQRLLATRLEEMARVARDATDETRRLNDLFTQHDLGALAVARPGLVERRIDAGSDDAVRLLECASGADRQDCAD